MADDTALATGLLSLASRLRKKGILMKWTVLLSVFGRQRWRYTTEVEQLDPSTGAQLANPGDGSYFRSLNLSWGVERRWGSSPSLRAEEANQVSPPCLCILPCGKNNGEAIGRFCHVWLVFMAAPCLFPDPYDDAFD